MGLFRRGTQLLRLGSGLRDCCCRPEKPEECWCPDTCRYYFEWGGSRRFPARTLAEETCPHPADFFAESIDEPYGLCYSAISTNQTTGDKTWFWTGDIVGDCGGMIFSIQQRLSGVAFKSDFTDAALDAEFNPYNPNVFYGFNLTAVVYTGMTGLPVFSDQPPNTWAINFNTYTNVLIQVLFGRSEILFLEERNAVVYVPARCQANAMYGCSQDGKSRLHLDENANFFISGDGVTFNGTLHEWAITTTHENQANDWRVEGEYPFGEELSLSIRGKATCQPGDCDCEADLTGSTVVFEGKTFTYGSLEEFVSEDGVTRWSETSAGFFVRVDYDTCDPSQFFPASTVTAAVFCITEDGQDYWGVALQRQCAERSVCQASTDAGRTTNWSGFFDCSSDGKPTGAAHALGDGSQPPDLDTDVTSGGVLSGDCVGDPAVPSISFS